MPIIGKIKGDIVDLINNSKLDTTYFAHGCNCQNVMGAGVAGALRKAFPPVYYTDLNYRSHKYTNFSVYVKSDNVIIINLYTQLHPGRVQNQDELYNAIRIGFEKLNRRYSGEYFIIPKIGSGIAGGDWNMIQEIINDVTPDISISVCEM
ncbi:hypothetical protein VmeM32_00164 [Vibrio phage vB_VmeM-32]|nr:hypothetical protein VmeM32_00164 [Vibrio phage vB_VmeM-32]